MNEPHEELQPLSESSPIVVGIGASAGGLDALKRFFGKVPQVVDVSFVVIQHFPKNEKSNLAEILSDSTRLPIVEITENSKILPGMVYISPSSHLIRLEKDTFKFTSKEEEATLPIDYFLSSLAGAFKDHAVAVILSGHGSDGSAGVKSIKESGGHALIQTPESAQFDGMPGSIAAEDLSDGQASSEELWNLLQTTLESAGLLPASMSSVLSEIDSTYSGINGLLKELYGFDFTPYKTGTIVRRIQRRMETKKFEAVKTYFDYLKGHLDESYALYQDLFICVTGFFRDPDTFKLLRMVLQAKFESAEYTDTIRVWSVGCATGEEPYSLAIMLDELSEASGYEGEIEIYGTDINEKPLEKAQAGIYRSANLKDLPEGQLEANFNRVSEASFEIHRKIRDRVSFIQHDIINDTDLDGPFDLISCRNLLIYLEPKAQLKVMAKLKAALRPGGILLLGGSEHMDIAQRDFKAISSKHKVFEKLPEHSAKGGGALLPPHRLQPHRPEASLPKEGKGKNDCTNTMLISAEEALLQQYAGPGLILTGQGNILRFIGKHWDHLADYKKRKATSLSELSIALQEVFEVFLEAKESIKEGHHQFIKDQVDLSPDGEENLFTVTVEYLDPGGASPAEEAYFMRLIEHDRSVGANGPEVDSSKQIRHYRDRAAFLERELQSSRQSLNTTFEEIRTSNEELLSMNEELHVSNQELQSISDELHTANDELKYRNDELQQLSQIQETLINSVETGVLLLDADFKLAQYNSSAKSLFDLNSDQIGCSIDSIASELEKPEDFFDKIKALANSSKAERLYLRDTQDRIYHARITPFEAIDGTGSGLLIVFTNLTENIYTQGLVNAMKATGLACWDYDVSSERIDVYNEGACVLGYDLSRHSRSAADDWFKHVHEEDLPALKADIERCCKGEATEWSTELRMRSKTDEWIWMRATGKAVNPGADGKALKMSGIIKSIQEQKDLEFDLIRSVKQAQDSAKAKSDFLSVMSHEIRTPLNGVVGMAELLREELSENRVVEEYVQIIGNSAEVLLDLVNAILDFTRPNNSEIELHPEQLDLAGLVETVLHLMKAKANKSGIEINFRMNLDHRAFVLDAVRLRQIFFNLLDNAIKFSDEGQHIRFSIDEKSNGILVIRVKDRGIGMSEDTLGRIYEPFMQADSSSTRKYGGAGLGLSIVKKLVTLMDGKIEVQSSLGSGTEFSASIPCNPVKESTSVSKPPDEKSAKAEEVKAKLNALIVDDNELNASVMVSMLARMGIDAKTVSEKRACFDHLRKFEFDLIFMDLHLPDSSGIEIAKEILEDYDIPIVAFTADASKAAHHEALGVGMIGPLVKPVSIATVRELLSVTLKLQEDPANFNAPTGRSASCHRT